MSINRRGAKGEARRTQILETALELFSTQGFEGTTTRQIAERVGLSEAGIFRYFPSKAEIFRGVVAEYGPRRFFSTPPEGPLAEDTTELLRYGLEWYLDVFWERRAMFRMMILESWRDPEASGELRSQFNEHQAQLVESLQSLGEMGEFRAEKAVAAADVVSASIGGFLLRSIEAEPDDWPAARSVFVDHLITIVLDGLRR